MRGVAATLGLATILAAGAFWQWDQRKDPIVQPGPTPARSFPAGVPAPVAEVTRNVAPSKPANPPGTRTSAPPPTSIPPDNRQSLASSAEPPAPVSVPSSATPTPIPAAATSAPAVSPAPASVLPTVIDPPPAQAGSKSKPVTEVTIKKDAVIGIRIDRSVNAGTAKVDDKVTARISRDVVVDGRIAIPADARLEGLVTVVERAGSTSGRERLGIRFSTLILPDDTKMAIQTETIFRDGETGSPALARSATPVPVARGSGSGVRNPVFNTIPGVPALVAGSRTDAFIPGGSQLTVKLTAPLVIAIGGE